MAVKIKVIIFYKATFADGYFSKLTRYQSLNQIK